MEQQRKIIDLRDQSHREHIAKICRTDTPKFIHFCYVAIFANLDGVISQTGTEYLITKKGKLRAIETKNFLYIEQNPEKTSISGKKAKQGVKIMWLIEKGTREWPAYVEEGKLNILDNPAASRILTKGLLKQLENKQC